MKWVGRINHNITLMALGSDFAETEQPGSGAPRDGVEPNRSAGDDDLMGFCESGGVSNDVH